MFFWALIEPHQQSHDPVPVTPVEGIPGYTRVAGTPGSRVRPTPKKTPVPGIPESRSHRAPGSPDILRSRFYPGPGRPVMDIPGCPGPAYIRVQVIRSRTLPVISGSRLSGSQIFGPGYPGYTQAPIAAWSRPHVDGSRDRATNEPTTDDHGPGPALELPGSHYGTKKAHGGIHARA